MSTPARDAENLTRTSATSARRLRHRHRAGRRHRPARGDEPAAARHRQAGRRLADRGTDALIADPGERWSVVLANPPFGRKSSVTMVGADGRESREDREIERQDFVVTTANKQLNFVQHIKTILDINGRAAVVLPDNVLFEGGAGETLRRGCSRLRRPHDAAAADRDLLRPGCEGQRAVLRQEAGVASSRGPRTLWVYDFRTNQHFTLKQNQLRRAAPRRVRRLLPARQASRRARRVRAIQVVHLRRAGRRATRSTSTSPGCVTSRSRTSTTCPHPRSSPARSSRTSPPRSPSSKPSQPHSKRRLCRILQESDLAFTGGTTSCRGSSTPMVSLW